MQPIIIIGAPRSGTNMLRDALTSLPDATTWNCDEINPTWRYGNWHHPTDELLPDHARPEVIRYIRTQFTRQARAGRAGFVVEKTCANSLRVPFVDRVVPEARYVFIVRDGRDAVPSAVARWTGTVDLGYVLRKARYVPRRELAGYLTRVARGRLRRRFSPDHRPATWGPRFAGFDQLAASSPPALTCAHQWARCVTTAADALAALGDERVVTTRYEDLIATPAAELARVAGRLGIPARPADVVRAIGPIEDRRGNGRPVLSPSDLEMVMPVLAPVLATYRYT